jgi:crotonobetainyl-CoA:carnitine CoA-transferase CaiB-like acyl-CoA transferase
VGETSAYFYALNRNKRSIVLDLKQPSGVAAFRKILPRYDVLVENHRPGVMERLGLGPSTLLLLNPRLIVCSLTGYGQDGPDQARAGHDLNYVARGGLLGNSGPPGTPPPLLGMQAADVAGGSLFALVAIFTALRERDRTGKGQHIDLSLTDGTLALLHMSLGARLAQGSEGSPLQRGVGLLAGGVPSYGVYRTADDRYLAVSSLEPKFLHRLVDALGIPRELALPEGSPEERERFREAVADRLARQPLSHWQNVFSAIDACVEPVLEGDEVLTDPQLKARGMFFTLFDPALGRDVAQLRSPLRFGETPTRPPPALGADTEAILREAALSADEIRDLTRRY